MKTKLALISLVLMIIGFLGGYLWKQNIPTKFEETQQVEVKQELPKCFAGICPLYYAMDVDGDGRSESAVIIPTAMTQGAGKVWIINDNNDVIFDSGVKMRIYAYQSKEQVEQGNGFILQYGTEVNSTNGVEINYTYKDGQFIPEEISN